ncbi:MAG: hypothetical protein ACFE0O_15105, partial [Opitutales bacterium]
PAVSDPFPSWPNQMWPPNPDKRPTVELFDLQSDPACWYDRAQDPELATIRDDLLARLEAWRRETDDPLLHGMIPDAEDPPDAGDA